MKMFLVLLNVFFLLTAVILIANPSDLEDVLNPEPDPESYYFLQPFVGVGYSFPTTTPVGSLSLQTLSEITNPAIKSGEGLNFDIGGGEQGRTPGKRIW
ncbi:MAG: hypothetical protein J4G05_10400 [Chlorobi bacterium]|nr:hypothetical protein [Chlorobiota bacterium]